MSYLDKIRHRAADAFAATDGHNLSFDIWKAKARQFANAINGTEDKDTSERDYWIKRQHIIAALT